MICNLQNDQKDKARNRKAAWLARQAAGIRRLYAAVEICPGLTVLAIELDPALFDDEAIARGLLTSAACDFDELVNEAALTLLGNAFREPSRGSVE